MPLSSESLDRPLRDLAYSAPAPAAAAPAHQSAEIHLRDYVALVMKRKWLILSLAVVVTSLVAIQMYRLPSIYEATTTIQIEQRNRSVLQSRDLVINAPSDPAYWSTQLKLIENPELARQVILTLDLQNNPAFLGGQSRSFLSALRRAFRGERPPPQMEAGVPVLSEGELDFGEKLSVEQLERLEPYEDTLRANLVVDPTEKTSLVDIRYQHPNPEIAMRVADALAAVFILRDNVRETQGTTKAAEALAREIADLQTKIRENEAARLSYMIGSNLPLNEAKGQNLTAERLGMLSSQLLTAENELKNFTAAFKAAQTTMDTKDIWSIPEVVESKSVQRLRDKIGDLEERRSALMVQYTAEWPEVKKVDEQIARLKQDLDKTPREIVNSIRARYEASIDKVNKLRQEYSRELGAANQMSIAEMGMSNLNQQLETNKQFYNTLYQKQKELQITSSDRSNNVSVSTPARMPRSPIGPQRGRNILIAFILSLGAGVGLAFLLDYLDDTLNTVEDVDRHLQLPTLALIPAPRAARLTLRGKTAAAALATKGAASEVTALALIEDVRSPVAEAYRHLRTSLLLSTAGQPPKTMLVTSSQPSEGKTTTAVNTAMMLAQTGVEVLIVDCDLRRPRIHAHFALPNTRGVTNYLSGESNLDELIQTCDKVPNLKVLTSGRIPPSAAELLGSSEMQRLLQELSGRFNHIVIDSPPTISFTDASILSTLVDGVILVVHGGRSSRGVVRRAKQQLHDVGAHIFGIVLNNVKAESSDYYYNNYYSGYYADEEETAADEVGAERRGAS